MSLQTARDIPLLIQSENASSERRITPSWTIAKLKSKLEPITGIPPSCQSLSLRLPSHEDVVIEAQDEESTEIGGWKLQAYAEIHVTDTRPPSSRPHLPPLSSVPKYEMPSSTYESLPSTVLSYKKAHKIGRFDPLAPETEKLKVEEEWKAINAKNLTTSPPSPSCVSLLPTLSRHGTVRYIGPVVQLPGPHDMPWLGIELDEPQGKNDGTVNGVRYFECGKSRGVFVRVGKIAVGGGQGDEEDGLEDEDEDEEEI